MPSSHQFTEQSRRGTENGEARQGPSRLRPLKQAASGATHALPQAPSEPQDQLRGHHIARGNGAALGTAMRPDGQRRADFQAAQAMWLVPAGFTSTTRRPASAALAVSFSTARRKPVRLVAAPLQRVASVPPSVMPATILRSCPCYPSRTPALPNTPIMPEVNRPRLKSRMLLPVDVEA